ncbi:MAG: response regulator transcription factor [Flavisolibacter sp.]|nr:response regulator transcription factor [Flavisolibacter sp.]
MIKVIIAEDQALYRDGLRMLLQDDAEISITGEAANGLEVMDLVLTKKPDVIITDIEMPQMDGVELTRELQGCYPEIKVVALTAFPDDYLIVDMLEAGAKGYLLKSSSREKIVEAIHAVHANGMYFCESTSMKLMKKIADSKLEMSRKEDAGMFTENEKKIVQLICQQFSSKEIGEKMYLGLKTIESYRNKIYGKMGVKNMAGVVIYAIRCGLFRP